MLPVPIAFKAVTLFTDELTIVETYNHIKMHQYHKRVSENVVLQAVF